MTGDLRRAAHDVHAAHEWLDGFSAEQIWHDGCPTCEARGELVMIEKLDAGNFRRAWYRAYAFQTGSARHVARCEVKLLNTLAQVQAFGVTLIGEVRGAR